jgi:hypothetical protein
VTVKHVVGGRNKQVLPQWKCHWCNIQFDNMGSVIFFECDQCFFTEGNNNNDNIMTTAITSKLTQNSKPSTSRYSSFSSYLCPKVWIKTGISSFESFEEFLEK